MIPNSSSILKVANVVLNTHCVHWGKEKEHDQVRIFQPLDWSDTVVFMKDECFDSHSKPDFSMPWCHVTVIDNRMSRHITHGWLLIWESSDSLLEGVEVQLCAVAHPQCWTEQQAYSSFLGSDQNTRDWRTGSWWTVSSHSAVWTQFFVYESREGLFMQLSPTPICFLLCAQQNTSLGSWDPRGKKSEEGLAFYLCGWLWEECEF